LGGVHLTHPVDQAPLGHSPASLTASTGPASPFSNPKKAICSPMPAPSRSRSAFTTTLCLVVALVAGCGDKSTLGTLHDVSGKVTIDGNPMTGGSVRFVPDKSKGNQGGHEPVGVIGSDGTYTLSTAGKTGAPPGWYKVTVASGDIPESSKPFAAKSALNPRYNSPEFTDLNVEVVSSPKSGAYDLKLSSK
jgi:hypothetical protein